MYIDVLKHVRLWQGRMSGSQLGIHLYLSAFTLHLLAVLFRDYNVSLNNLLVIKQSSHIDDVSIIFLGPEHKGQGHPGLQCQIGARTANWSLSYHQ